MYGLFHISIHTDCMDCTVSVPSFTYLTIRTDRDISRSRRLFETKRVALGSWWWGLRSRLFWGNSENVDFWAKIWPLVQILITPSHWKAFGPTKAYDYLSSFNLYQPILLEKSFRQSPEYFDMPCTATGYVPQPLFSGCCWPTVLSVLGRLPTFPLRIKSFFRTLYCQQNQLSNGCKTSCDILSQGKKTSILKNKSYKIEKWCQQNLLSFKQTVASCTPSRYMVFSKSTFKSINTIN